MSHSREHWNKVYAGREDSALTWHEDAPETALEIIRARLAPGQAVIDVGGGTSRLAESLVAEGYGPVSVLDLSQQALARNRARMGENGRQVSWIAADVTTWEPDRTYALWHDRAVFHFLTDPADRAAYVARMARALAPGGLALISTFADDGPEKCSGLPVQRYAPQELADELERHAPGQFVPLHARRHDHRTPAGNIQKFQTSLFRRR